MTIIPMHSLQRIAARFDLPDPVFISDFPDRGNIHRHTFLVESGRSGDIREFLLQCLNTDVFPDIETVLDNMISCIHCQQKALNDNVLGENPGWEPIRLIPTREGKAYLRIDEADLPPYWRMMAKIPNSSSYKNLGEIDSAEKRYTVAREAGKGLAMFERLTAGMRAERISVSLPGYRDTGLYYGQLESVLGNSRTPAEAAPFLPQDPFLRENTSRHFLVSLSPDRYKKRLKSRQVPRLIETALDNKHYCLKLQGKLKRGELKTTVVHGDTKLDNFLFDEHTGKVKALVDLDTVMPHTWLSDWGDMARSLVNTSGEFGDSSRGSGVDIEVFKALAYGFIRSAPQIPRDEISYMVDAARIMALELGVRFLTDYLRGDTYFGLPPDAPEDLNRTRAEVQFSVFHSLGGRADEVTLFIKNLYEEKGKEGDGGPDNPV